MTVSHVPTEDTCRQHSGEVNNTIYGLDLVFVMLLQNPLVLCRRENFKETFPERRGSPLEDDGRRESDL